MRRDSHIPPFDQPRRGHERLCGGRGGGDEPGNTCSGDANGDGVVDGFDIEAFLLCLFP